MLRPSEAAINLRCNKSKQAVSNPKNSKLYILFARAMAVPSHLCSVCIQIVQPKLRSAVFTEYITPKGQTLEIFQRAAEQYCFICFSLLNLSGRHRIEWANLQPSSWTPLSFCVRKESESFMWLSVVYQDPTRHRDEFLTDVRFQLIHLEGRISPLLYFMASN